MTTTILTHPVTTRQLEAFRASNHHALLLVGSVGSGKRQLALTTAAALLDDAIDVEEHPYVRIVEPEDGKSLSIEAIRDVTSFLRLKVPGQRQGPTRVVVIPDAQLMTTEAQNALLKTLEEPPEGSVLILTATSERALLPTISSRTQTIAVKRLPRAEIEDYFQAQGHDATLIAKNYQVSGGLIGLMQALLNDNEHPLLLAVETARQLLQRSAFERLAMVDGLAKQPALSRDTMFVLQQMAHVSLQTTQAGNQKRWQAILTAAYDAESALTNSGQAKLVLTNFMLRF